MYIRKVIFSISLFLFIKKICKKRKIANLSFFPYTLHFEHEVIFCNLTKQLAEMFEVELIKYYNTTNIQYGYNLANGGKCGNKGLKRSDEFRLLMSKYAKNRRGEKSNHFNKKHSEETKLK